MVSVVPFEFCVGGVQLSVAEPLLVEPDETVIAYAGSEALPPLPSLTLMMMFEYVPVCALLGVPDSLPVVVLNVAHAGLFVTLNASVSPFASFAVGVNEYRLPATTVFGGVPLIYVSELLVPEPLTVIEKLGRFVLMPLLSVTRMMMLENVPTLALVGVP